MDVLEKERRCYVLCVLMILMVTCDVTYDVSCDIGGICDDRNVDYDDEGINMIEQIGRTISALS